MSGRRRAFRDQSHRRAWTRPAGGWSVALLWLLMTACSVLKPSYTAEQPGDSGKAPVEVTVAIRGNTGLGDVELRGRIEDYLYDLSRDPTRESAVYDAALEVEDYYRTQGYPIAKVTYEYTPPGEDDVWPKQVHVVLRVQEGPLVTVAMHLTGNQVFETNRLLDLWARKRSGTFSLGGVIFVESQIRNFVEELRTFYRAAARLDAVITGPELDVDLETGLAKVAITIDEGHVHTIQSVEVAEVLRAALGPDLPAAPIGNPYARSQIQAYRDALRAALRQRGYPNPVLEITAETVDAQPFLRTLTVTGQLGLQTTIESLSVQGNQKTLDAVILGKLDLEPGDRYDGSKIDEALRRLYQTGLFRKVEIKEVPVEDDPSRLALGVQVEENESRAIEFLAGYGSYEQLRGGLRLEERNLFGTGRGVAFDNRLSQKGYSTGLSFTDPDFLSTRSTLTLSGEYFSREEPSFTDRAVGGTLALSRPLVSTLTTRVGYTYRTRTDARAFAVLPQNQFVDFVEGKVFVELRNDRRDNLLFPKSGHTEFLSFERISPDFGANVDLDRLTFRAALYLTLFEPVRLVLRSEQSVLWAHEGSDRVPLQERWFGGGESSVRSFRESELGPKDNEGLPIGGEYRNLISAELRFPLWGTLEGGLFADTGNVGSRVQDYSLDHLRYGLGGGLRLLLPIGPVRLDAAWNPDQEPGDDEWVVHLSIGYPF